MREAEIERITKETRINMNLNIDGSGKGDIESGIGFFDHMLESFAVHGLFDIKARIKGDLKVDQHHTVEDTGFVLGLAFKKALGAKEGIKRSGFSFFPMDESLAFVAVDLSGRAYARVDAKFRGKKIGDLSTEVIDDFFEGFARGAESTLHAKVLYGRSDHHRAEALFKAFARSMKEACEIEGRGIRSAKGVI